MYAALWTLPPPGVSLNSIVCSRPTHQPQKGGRTRMSGVVVRVAHLVSDLGRDVADDDSWHVTFDAGEVVAVEVKVVEDFLVESSRRLVGHVRVRG